MIAAPSNLASLPPATGKVQCALISVFDKTGIVEFAKALHALDVSIVSSGGTAKRLQEAGVPVTPVEEHTGAQEVLGGRVKTLHPKIHAGILADRRVEDHLSDLNKHGYQPVDLVVCNLYPFSEALKKGSERHIMVENIDIGGPTLIRAAAKNADGGVTVCADPTDYDAIISGLKEGNGVPLKTRRELASKAFSLVATYDLAIANWFSEDVSTAEEESVKQLPAFAFGLEQVSALRYGENPHQPAALYREASDAYGVAHGTQLAGKPLSYNNFLDMDAAYRAVFGFERIGCSVVKHTNPCGLAVAESQADAFLKAFEGDPVSAFGSILGFNRPLEADTVRAIQDKKLFVECIAAPDFTPEAQELLAKKKNLRLFQVPAPSPHPALNLHRIGGGALVQVTDPGLGDVSEWQCVTQKQLEDGWMEELQFAMLACGVLKSNAISVTKNGSLLGAGAGQMSRVDAVEQAFKKAGEGTQGAFLGSDAFFPFDDCVRLAHAQGIVAVVQPGGSKRDQESIDACDELGMAMVFTGRRHFRH